MQKQTKYTLEMLETVMEKMKAAPAPAKANTHYSKAESVRLMIKEIQSMQKRGYTMKMISDFLHENGIEIKEAVLKSYIQRGKTPATAKTAKTAKQSTNESAPKNTSSTTQSKPATTSISDTNKSNAIEDVE